MPCPAEELAARLDELEILPFTDPEGSLQPAAEAEAEGNGSAESIWSCAVALVRADALEPVG